MAIVCHCEAVRERTIVKAIHRGAHTLSDIQAACGAVTDCGGCSPAVMDLLERHCGAGAQAVSVRQWSATSA